MQRHETNVASQCIFSLCVESDITVSLVRAFVFSVTGNGAIMFGYLVLVDSRTRKHLRYQQALKGQGFTQLMLPGSRKRKPSSCLARLVRGSRMMITIVINIEGSSVCSRFVYSIANGKGGETAKIVGCFGPMVVSEPSGHTYK